MATSWTRQVTTTPADSALWKSPNEAQYITASAPPRSLKIPIEDLTFLPKEIGADGEAWVKQTTTTVSDSALWVVQPSAS